MRELQLGATRKEDMFRYYNRSGFSVLAHVTFSIASPDSRQKLASEQKAQEHQDSDRN
jgi:hypothetical protein